MIHRRVRWNSESKTAFWSSECRSLVLPRRKCLPPARRGKNPSVEVKSFVAFLRGAFDFEFWMSLPKPSNHEGVRRKATKNLIRRQTPDDNASRIMTSAASSSPTLDSSQTGSRIHDQLHKACVGPASRKSSSRSNCRRVSSLICPSLRRRTAVCLSTRSNSRVRREIRS